MAHVINSPYGAFEQKSMYQRNMLLGTAAVVLTVGLIVFSVWIYRVITDSGIPDPTNVYRITKVADLGAPPSLAAKKPNIDIAKPKVEAPKVGIPTPVPDDEISEEEDMVIASREELQEINAPVFGDGDESGDLVIDIPLDDYMPSPDEFVAYEVLPEEIYVKKPVFPRLALEGGFTGYVIIQAYIDKNGNVKKAQSVKCNRPNMGFEEAAIKAAYKYKYRPAIQNGNPVGLWITYRVEFVL